MIAVIGKKLGMSRQGYINLEANPENIKIKHLLSLTKLYNCSLNTIFGIGEVTEKLEIWEKADKKIKEIEKKAEELAKILRGEK